jgi:hypothetical protein
MTKHSDIVEKSKNYVKSKFDEELPAICTYHNYSHTQNVVNAVMSLAEEANISEEEREVLIIAAYFHDIGFIINAEGHEDHGIKIASDFLKGEEYPNNLIQKVIACINATKMQWSGSEKICTLMKDADLSGLSSKNYAIIIEGLRLELNARDKKNIDKETWREQNISFLENHSYLSNEGKKIFKKGKQQNLKTLKMSDEKKKKKIKLLTIGSSKSAQTQFKTALRNHIDLSSIADNKANIMLSVNAIIITVALPLLINRISENENLLIPTSILAIVSLISMIFATLSTRPIAMKGLTKKEDVSAKKSNLFFFGNYYNMSFSDYEEYVGMVVADDEILDNSITRDLFFLGKSLGKKFEYLRWCYNFFMYGIAAAVLSFFIVSLI